MNKLSKLAETLKGSEIVKLGNAINERIRQGEKIYNFTIGDFDPSVFPIPSELEELIIEAYRNHYTNYPPADGIYELRKAVKLFIQEHEQLNFEMNEILIASGGRPLIYTLFKTIADPGDKVIYAVPSWNNNHYSSMNGVEHCMVEATPENNFMPHAGDIARNIKGAVLVCLCTPQNPTGTTLQKEELEKICDIILQENASRSATEKKVYLMFDQMYWKLTYGNTVHYNPLSLRPEMKHCTIFIDGISKVFAATGVRVGWALGPSDVIAKMKALLSHVGAWAPMAEQKAVASFLMQKDAVNKYLEKFKASLEERLHKIYEGFVKLKQKGFPVDAITPQAAIYLTIKIDIRGKSNGNKILTTQYDATDYILGEAKLAVVPFYAFGAESNSPWYRLSVGTCHLEEIDPVFEQLEAALQKLR
ncbi:aminotransferase class I/II-fold pyridoxal phosphate-dependent enzyme [Panacibacter ginsenosidivorans]|uniref:Aminotransferase class I/II-fold pyridoxal phosphate-dependent enzyme n=1 Tax=Panacibacter ginsenosidivorans TaxID=1813871 RepID=A0A5B8V9I2_9BACT|nr:aminotransferase class I/II-fold pyridoxal phosphate-dependent enzyme [Panacibacter ginsenosidivorans]QEC67583.1 aminotransferase class I/II-fold pyridoxal phosphate-dependent enzyme [Panacibacter ginsenosidivorans]